MHILVYGFNLSASEHSNSPEENVIACFCNESLARVGVVVPLFPGKGERRYERESLSDYPMAFKKFGTGGRRAYSALPVPGILPIL